MATLSKNDNRVLGALFDSESSLSKVVPVDENAALLPGISSQALRNLQESEAQIIRPLNSEYPPREDISNAVEELTYLIEQHPDYASAYNNRAQAVRMLVGDDLLSLATSQSSLYSDLTKACELGRPSSPRAFVSPLQARILASAHTHRGHLIYKASRKLAEVPEQALNLPVELKGMDREALERLAGRDFQFGGMYGNPVARQMAVQLNPYAKMCGEIVKEAMRNDIKESYQGSLIGAETND